jgi:hypothetical protein
MNGIADQARLKALNTELRIAQDMSVVGFASFRWEGFQHNSTTPERKPVKTACHELSHAGGDDHRPVESVKETVPVRSLLLRPEKLHYLPARARTQGSGAKEHVLH